MSSADGPVLVASGVQVRLGGTEILHGISVALDAGRITGLLGPSGSGKTTLMRTIVGTQRLHGGTLRVLGRPAGDPELRRVVGYASQQASVYTDLTVIENLRYFAAALDARHDVDRVLDRVSMTRHRDRLTGGLSGGERSRVSLAVALLGSPRLLVLDEPTVGLDPAAA